MRSSAPVEPAGRPPALGVGVVWWPALAPLAAERGLIEVAEAEPEAYWIPCADSDGTRRFESHLAFALAELPQPKLLHGVGAPLGGSCQPPAGHIARFAEEIRTLKPAWVSEHLSFSSFASSESEPDPHFAGFLLPPAQSVEGASMCAANIRDRRTALGNIPLAFETNVNYLPPLAAEIPDGDFAAIVAERADCGILLDLHNLFCNERNGRQPAAEFCSALPLERVWELHVAGGEDMRGFHLDAHSGLVDPVVMELAADLIPRLPNLGAIVFEIMPEYVAMTGLGAIAKQLEHLHDLWRRRGAAADAGTRLGELPDDLRQANFRPLAPAAWEALLGAEITNRTSEAPADDDLACWHTDAKPALDVYRWLASEARAGMLTIGAPRSIRLLLTQAGSKRARALLATFWARSTPAYTALEESEAFLQFVSETADSVPGLSQAVAEDRTALREIVSGLPS